MATTDKQRPRQGRPEGITCPHYAPKPGSKRCRHYLPNGACDRPDELMCREWVRLNGHLSVGPAEPEPAEAGSEALAISPVDMFGNPNPAHRRTEPEPSQATSPRAATDLFGNPLPEPKAPRRVEGTAPVPSGGEPRRLRRDEAGPTEPDERSPLRGLTTEDIESFKALRVEVCLSSEAFGEVWLVPEYTGRDRKEITPEHAATICRVIEAFPGSRVIAFEKNPKPSKEADA